MRECQAGARKRGRRYETCCHFQIHVSCCYYFSLRSFVVPLLPRSTCIHLMVLDMTHERKRMMSVRFERGLQYLATHVKGHSASRFPPAVLQNPKKAKSVPRLAQLHNTKTEHQQRADHLNHGHNQPRPQTSHLQPRSDNGRCGSRRQKNEG